MEPLTPLPTFLFINGRKCFQCERTKLSRTSWWNIEFLNQVEKRFIYRRFPYVHKNLKIIIADYNKWWRRIEYFLCL